MSSRINTQKLVYTGLLAALAGVLMSLEFSIPFFPPFYKIDFSDMPTLIALFSMGPLSALFVEVSKIIIKLITIGTSSMFVGDLTNILGSFVYVLPVWFLYKRSDKSQKSIVKILIISAVIRTAWYCFCNAFISLPMYAAAMGVDIDEVVRMVGSVNPMIQNLPSFIIFATIPFNIIKMSLVYTVAAVVNSKIKEVMPNLLSLNTASRA